MNDAPTPQILPPSQQPPVYGPILRSYTPERTKRFIHLFVYAFIFLLLLISGIVGINLIKKPQQQIVQKRESQTVTPTPHLEISAFATESAFMTFEQTVESVQKTIAVSPITDGTLEPPSIEITLGYQK